MMSVGLSNIKHNLELLKALVVGSNETAREAKAKILQIYVSELDLSTLDRLLAEGKKELRRRGLRYEQLCEFYTSKTGRSSIDLSRAYLSLFYIEQNDFEEDFASESS